jgi:hypothetical protein
MAIRHRKFGSFPPQSGSTRDESQIIPMNPVNVYSFICFRYNRSIHKMRPKEVDQPAWQWKVIGQSVLRVTAWSMKQL